MPPQPEITYARQLERAASWASSVVFTTELAEQRLVPARFVDDVMRTAAREVKTIRADIAARDEVSEAVGPLIIVMNDKQYLKRHTNGFVTDIAVVVIIGMAFVLAVLAIPVQWLGH